MSFGIKRDKYDAIVSDVVRYRDRWTCQRCNKHIAPPTKGIQCSHFRSRAHGGTRYLLENCDSLCTGCHVYFGSNQDIHRAWKIQRIGQGGVDLLDWKARHPHKMTRPDKELMHAELKKELGKFKAIYEQSHYADNLPFLSRHP